MHEGSKPSSYVRMVANDYYDDFESEFEQCADFLKLERAQVFAEPGNGSWEAFARGEWDAALCLLDDGMRDLRSYHAEMRARGASARRVRVVSEPLSSYMRWELEALVRRDLSGGPIRVVDVGRVGDLEQSVMLPEVYTMDERIVYRALYDENGVLEFAEKCTDSNEVRMWRERILALFGEGEPILTYYTRRGLAGVGEPGPAELEVPSNYLDGRGRRPPIRS